MSNTAKQEQEYELTYLAASMPKEINDVTPVEMIDAYVPDDSSVHSRLRIRKSGDSFQITKKVPSSGGDASVHTETTLNIDEDEFDSLISNNNKKVSKLRYKVNINGSPAEVDVFKEDLEGLVVIDFEFDSEAEKNDFVAPSVCLADITQEDFIAGGLIAGKSYKDIRPDLDRFNYQPLYA